MEPRFADRREWIFDRVRQGFRPYVTSQGVWQSPPGANAQPDPRVLAEVALPFLLGDEADRALAECLLRGEAVRGRINQCSFTTEYVLAAIHGAGDSMPDALRDYLYERIEDGLLRYAKKDLQHHGYNDNHVTLATASLILGGELIGNRQAVDEGRANLLNFRDTFLRRGFMHETNDCYLPHSLYSTAAVAAFARDEECRELATQCEARIWADLIGHWHPNLGRKPGPSARDYTGGRLNQSGFALLLWLNVGDCLPRTATCHEDVLSEQPPPERYFAFNGDPHDNHWNLGFAARLAAHDYHLPEGLRELLTDRRFPHRIRGTHEVGHFNESGRTPDGGNDVLPVAIPFSAREIYTEQYQEADWAMGTASQRMIGNCPNNNWSIAWRKRQPFTRTADQNILFCSYTINDKSCTGRHAFELEPGITCNEDVEHWFDNGRYAAIQHERTAIMLYRPRLHDHHRLTSLATTLVMPFCWKNHVDRLCLGDRDIEDFNGEAEELCDIFIADGPLYIGIRPLLSRPQPCAGPRIIARREACWGTIHLTSYRGPAMDLPEIDLCRIGGGFLCEVATTSDFPTLDAFRDWFRQGELLDDQQFFMRQVRYQRDGLALGIRYDVWNDAIMYRMLNGRSLPMPPFDCTGIDPASLPWLTDDAADLDHLSWAVRQSRRELAPHCIEPGRITH